MDIDAITGPGLATVADLLDFRESLATIEFQHPGLAFAFRGQPKEFGSLIPSFQRQFTRPSRGAAVLIESRLISAFRQHYAALSDRSVDMPAPAQIGEGFDLRCLSVMQHYEIPTRLLDWTTDFWTAVYFACTSEPGSPAEIWYYDRRMFERQRQADVSLQSLVLAQALPPPEPPLLQSRDEDLIVELDPRLTARMKHQSGFLTVSSSPFADHAPLIDTLCRDLSVANDAVVGLRRVTLDAQCKPNALQVLAQEMGISASTIFPDVVGLGRFLRWQFDSLRTLYM